MIRKKLTVFDGILLALTIILGLVLILAAPAAKEALSRYRVMPNLLLCTVVRPVFLLCYG